LTFRKFGNATHRNVQFFSYFFPLLAVPQIAGEHILSRPWYQRKLPVGLCYAPLGADFVPKTMPARW